MIAQCHRLFALAALSLTAALSAAETATIPNPLGLSWPGELVYLTVDPNAGIQSATLQDRTVPVQLETVTTADGERETRAWFIARIGKETVTDDRGREKQAVPREATVTFGTASQPAGISLIEDGDFYVIDNGVYQFRVRRYHTDLAGPTPLAELPHWCGGMRVGDNGPWDGRAWFEGSQPVTSVSVAIINQGPVFIDLHLTYTFDAEIDGETEALPLKMGKQTHTWAPNTPPRESIPKRSAHYEVKLRFVANDTWIEANERFHLPRDKDAGSFGVHQYWMQWGSANEAPAMSWLPADEHMPVDTVTWVRWFLYDQFGGNVDQRYVAAEPRPDQKGRPFAQLRPRWNQGGGGAQDFCLTSGGAPAPSIGRTLDRTFGGPIRDLKKQARNNPEAAATVAAIEPLIATARNGSLDWAERFAALTQVGEHLGREVRQPAANFDESNPAVALFAAFASKWVGPYPATIATYAYDGNRGRARFPLIDGERSGMHYGQRAYGLCVGPRSRFTSLNNLVRRHTDWTLLAQIHKYELNWERDESLAGPNATVTREQLAALRAAYEAQDGSVAATVLSEEAETYLAQRTRWQELKDQRDQANRTRRNREASQDDKTAAEAFLNETKDEWKTIDRDMNSGDAPLLGLILEGRSKTIKVPSAELWIQRRYQDDFLNPTSRMMRDVKNYANADLFAAGNPIGGPWNAALAYVITDLDAWPGWHQGWHPGNPNFHTDKYMGAIYIAAALRDHPHSDEWLQFGWDNYQQDLTKVFREPHGVGYECPGYAGYSMGIQLKLAKIFYNLGFGNAPVETPAFAGSGRWHRHLMTPWDRRIERRHEAPIGDTHRWDSGLGLGFGKLALFFRDEDPAFASEMMGMWQMLVDQGAGKKDRLRGMLLDVDPSIEPMPLAEMDWSSRTWFGFGAIMRTAFGTDQETFLSFKAGPSRGHGHNEELSYHYYADTTPISLDYNCSYHPRGDHAALHNSMTFGETGTVRHNGRISELDGKRTERDQLRGIESRSEEQEAQLAAVIKRIQYLEGHIDVEAMEQLGATGYPGAFTSGEMADVVVAERAGNGVSMSPVEPHDAEFSRRYPGRNVGALVHRRWLALIKHPEESPFTDYLVVRDETTSSIPQQVNVHLLARQLRSAENGRYDLEGQWDHDILVQVVTATDLRLEERQWHYYDEWMNTPGDEYTPQAGESVDDWNTRMRALMAEHNVDSLPLPGWKPEWRKNQEWYRTIRETNGLALVPPVGWNANWMYGERQVWLRLHTAPGTPVLWVLYPYRQGTEQPTIEPLADGTGVRLTLGEHSEEIFLATNPADGIAGQAVIRRDGVEEVLIAADSVGALGTIPHRPLTGTIDGNPEADHFEGD